MVAAPGVIQIRTYKLRAGAGPAFHRIATEDVLPMLARWGVEVVAFGPSLDDDDLYYLMRAYASPAELQRSQDAFYGSDEWREGPREGIVSLIEGSISVVVPADGTVIEPVRSGRPFPGSRAARG